MFGNELIVRSSGVCPNVVGVKTVGCYFGQPGKITFIGEKNVVGFEKDYFVKGSDVVRVNRGTVLSVNGNFNVAYSRLGYCGEVAVNEYYTINGGSEVASASDRIFGGLGGGAISITARRVVLKSGG